MQMFAYSSTQTSCICEREQEVERDAMLLLISREMPRERGGRARFLFALQRQENISLTATANYPAACC
jgi:hypothetical protein